MRALLLLVTLLALACSPEPASPPPVVAGPLDVFAVNSPLASLAREIGGSPVEVRFSAPAGVDPAYWSPDAETVAVAQQADLLLRSGAGYAAWVDRASLRARRVIDTSAGFREALLPVEDSVVHQHGPQGDHSHGELASTVWLDPRLALLQAGAVARAFSDARPDEAERFAAGLARVAARLEPVDRRLAAASGKLADAPLLLSHPVYQYPTARYGWNARALHWEPHEDPDGAAWQALDTLLVTHPARWMLWEGTPTEETRRRLEQRGITPVVFSPGANLPDGEDWLDLMEANAARFEAIAR